MNASSAPKIYRRKQIIHGPRVNIELHDVKFNEAEAKANKPQMAGAGLFLADSIKQMLCA